MPPCRLLIFVCFSLFARREASFISPDCHYPALNFHRAGREAGQGEAGRGAARALGGPVGLSPAPRGPCLHTASLNVISAFLHHSVRILIFPMLFWVASVTPFYSEETEAE